MAAPWYRFVARAFRELYYHRIAIVPAASPPDKCATLYVATHRNGAIDGYVYMQFETRANFMLASQLKRNAFIRLFFDGVEVVRDKDGGDQSENGKSLMICTNLLVQGEPLLIFPEGSSDLGFRHLPFKKGAARIADAFVESGQSLRIVPLALHYEAGWVWQSDVELLVGDAFVVQGEQLGNDSARALRRTQIHRSIVASLETLGVNAPDAASFVNWERLAYAATIGSGRGYAAALKFMQKNPGAASQLGAELDLLIERFQPWLHQGVPVIASRPVLYALVFAIRAPIAALAILLNAPVLAIALWAGRRFADDRNVIAFWRFVIGAPVGVLWNIGIATSCLSSGKPLWLAGWALVSVLGLQSIYRVRKLAIELGNALFKPRMRLELQHLQQKLGDCFQNHEL